MKKRLLAVIISFITLNMWADKSGRCGENVFWTYSEASNTLTISGNGKMDDYYMSSSVSGAPWCLNGYNTSIKKVYIKDGVTSIGNCAFYACSTLTSVTIGNSVTSIGSSAFDSCSKLTLVIIPNSVTTIGDGAFFKCSGLTSVTIGNNVTEIGYYAFGNCTGLISVTIPNSVTKIRQSAFSGCRGLTSVIIPNSVREIGDDVFYGCSALTSVTIGNSVTSIGDFAFYGCSALTSVHITDLVAWCKISFHIYDSNPLGLAKHLFMDGMEITDLVIPNSVTEIGRCAFSGCSGLESVTIGNSVKSIGSKAFQYCKNIENIFCHAITCPTVVYDAFDGVPINQITLHVPANSVRSYKNHKEWGNFMDIVPLIDDDTAIKNIPLNELGMKDVYNLNGRITNRIQRGLNLIRMKDGTVKKFIFK